MSFRRPLVRRALTTGTPARDLRDLTSFPSSSTELKKITMRVECWHLRVALTCFSGDFTCMTEQFFYVHINCLCFPLFEWSALTTAPFKKWYWLLLLSLQHREIWNFYEATFIIFSFMTFPHVFILRKHLCLPPPLLLVWFLLSL